MEWQVEQDLKCGDCGLPRDETMADERLVAQGLAPDYVAERHRCRACEAREAMARATREDEDEGDPGSGLKLIVREIRVNGNSHN